MQETSELEILTVMIRKKMTKALGAARAPVLFKVPFSRILSIALNKMKSRTRISFGFFEGFITL